MKPYGRNAIEKAVKRICYGTVCSKCPLYRAKGILKVCRPEYMPDKTLEKAYEIIYGKEEGEHE